MTNDNLMEVHFFIRYVAGEFAYRRLPQCPSVGDICVFGETRFNIHKVEWCLDISASYTGVRVNIELEDLN